MINTHGTTWWKLLGTMYTCLSFHSFSFVVNEQEDMSPVSRKPCCGPCWRELSCSWGSSLLFSISFQTGFLLDVNNRRSFACGAPILREQKPPKYNNNATILPHLKKCVLIDIYPSPTSNWILVLTFLSQLCFLVFCWSSENNLATQTQQPITAP